jgi:hypothetical protein
VARRFYIAPAETIPLGQLHAGGRRPAYVADLSPRPECRWMDFGMEPVFLLAAEVTAEQHATLAAQSPITVVPLGLAQNVGNDLVAVQSAIESWNIPAQWVTSGLTYRQVLKGVATIFQFAQRLAAMFRVRAFPPGITLDTTVSQLTQAQRDKLAAVSDSFGWDRSSVTGTTTMRQLLRGAAQQWNDNVLFGGEVLS